LRYWPNPYTTWNQGGPVKDAFEASPAFTAVVERARREALRLLYVGWTRARDRIILAAGKGKLTAGLLRTLHALDPTLISEPPGDQAGEPNIVWAGRSVTVRVRPTSAAESVSRAIEPGEVTVGRSSTAYPPARQSPSSAQPVPCTLGDPVSLGPRLSLRGIPDMKRVGHAVHGFLAADRPELEDTARIGVAQALLRRHGVDGNLDAAEVAAAGLRLWQWIDRTLSPTRRHREWPVTERLPSGTLVIGTVDLVVRSPAGLAVIDHKTFPGTLSAALDRLLAYSGQLAAYAHAITSATGDLVTSTWIHLPVLGVVVDVRVPT